MLLKLIPFLVVMPLISIAAPDRIGNGGGVWVCEDPSHTIYDIMFMDVFEARREYQLTLPETTGNPLDVVQAQKAWIEKFMPNAREINKHIEYVEKNITWIEDIINLIPDGANKISPHPSTCKQGDWTAVQLVNFTDDFRILVRRELFDSSFLTNLERAAVYLHEGIYSYLRTEFGDTTSVRTRAIVGYLLSDLSDTDKVARIQKVINQKVFDPNPPTTTGSWICGIKPERDSALYIAEDADAAKAKAAAVKACTDGEDHFGGMDFPSLPGLPNFGPPNACQENKVLCEQVTSSAKTKTCELTPTFGRQKVYTGSGRTQLEAQKEAMNTCLASEGAEYYCYSARDMNCK